MLNPHFIFSNACSSSIQESHLILDLDLHRIMGQVKFWISLLEDRIRFLHEVERRRCLYIFKWHGRNSPHRNDQPAIAQQRKTDTPVVRPSKMQNVSGFKSKRQVAIYVERCGRDSRGIVARSSKG